MNDTTSPSDKEEKEEELDYLDIVPREIELSVEALGKGDTSTKFAVLMVLLQADEWLTEPEIAEKDGIDNDDIDTLLDDLQRGGLISRKVGERFGDPTTGGYVITTYGERLLDGLYRSTQPKFTKMVGGDRNGE